MTDRAEVEFWIEEDRRILAAKPQHGGQRPGAGRPTVRRKKGEKKRAVWIHATDAEMAAIKKLSLQDRKLALLSRQLEKGNV